MLLLRLGCFVFYVAIEIRVVVGTRRLATDDRSHHWNSDVVVVVLVVLAVVVVVAAAVENYRPGFVMRLLLLVRSKAAGVIRC